MFYSMSLIISITFLFLFQNSFHLGWILSYLFSVNLTVMLLMGYDKLAARNGFSRVPEKVLHLYAIIGGTPFAYLSQKVFRHKTVKNSFRRVFHFILFIQILLIVLVVFWKYGYI